MHHHGSLGLLTPFDVHYGLAAKRTEERALVLQKAFEANPERFVQGAPKPAAVTKEVRINKPRTRNDEPDALGIDF
jgi:putative transposase